MKKYIRKHYYISSRKIQKNHDVDMVFISDLHNHCYGNQNDILIDDISSLQPDMILIGGDMIIGKAGCSVDTAAQLIRRLVKIAPVYHALGNHEYKMKCYNQEEYNKYESVLKQEGVCILDNNCKECMVKENVFSISGLTLPKKYFKRFKRQYLTQQDMMSCIGEAKTNACNILLAHTPCYGKTYFNWNADLILSGHYHGGMVRLGKRGVISPQFVLFPSFSYGRFDRFRQTMIVSSGMGEHTIPLRLFNPRELVVVHMQAE